MGYVSGSQVMTVVVHWLPEWLEWTLAVFLGFVVMELVRHLIGSNKFLRLIDGSERDKPIGYGERPTAAV